MTVDLALARPGRGRPSFTLHPFSGGVTVDFWPEWMIVDDDLFVPLTNAMLVYLEDRRLFLSVSNGSAIYDLGEPTPDGDYLAQRLWCGSVKVP